MLSPFYLMAKPSSNLCNIRCSYCFYVEKDLSHEPRMSDEVLEAYVKNYIETFPNSTVPFIFQGGEPTICGIKFYEKVVELQKKYANGKTILNSLQTNGIKINDDFAKFFAENNFLIGISIDGPRDLHNKCRLDLNGKGTFDSVMKGLDKLKKYNVSFNTLTVLSNINIKYPKEIYSFLKEIGSTYMQFIPLTGVKDEINPIEYGNFLNKIFDLWVSCDVKTICVQHIDEWLKGFMGYRPTLCIFREYCGDQLIIEQNGDIYSCDHFVDKNHNLGNILQQDLKSILLSNKQIAFAQNKARIHEDCFNCRYVSICNGGCPKHRTVNTEKGLQNYLCEGYKLALSHMESNLNKIQIALNS